MDVFGMWGDKPLCSVGGPALFIHDKCALHAWAALNRLNTSWKWLSVPTVERVPVKSRLKSRHVSPSISWVVLMLKAVLVRLLFVAHFFTVSLNTVLVALILPLIVSRRLKATCSSWGESVGMVRRATWDSLTSHYQSVHFPPTWL